MKFKQPYWIYITSLLVFSSCTFNADNKEMPSLRETYGKNDAIPFGSRVAHDLIKSAYPGAKMIVNYSNFTHLSPIKVKKNLEVNNSIYFLITKNLILNDDEVVDMINFVSTGNDLFIAADFIDKKLMETVYLTMNRGQETLAEMKDIMRNTSVGINDFANTNTGKNTFSYYYYPFLNYFTNYDEDITKVWGYNENSLPDFVQIKVNSGHVYLNAAPRSFSNYFLLTGNNKRYLKNVLNALPKKPSVVYWDEYYKNLSPQQNKNKLKGSTTDNSAFSSMQVVKKSPSLLMAFWLTVTGILLFVVINSKRKQRIIPKIAINKNATVEFTETIGKLYFQNKNNKRIAEKMITYFYEQLRNSYFIKTEMTNKDLVASLAGKSGIASAKVQLLITTIEEIQSKDNVTDHELLILNEQIESFNKNKNDRRK